MAVWVHGHAKRRLRGVFGASGRPSGRSPEGDREARKSNFFDFAEMARKAPKPTPNGVWRHLEVFLVIFSGFLAVFGEFLANFSEFLAIFDECWLFFGEK